MIKLNENGDGERWRKTIVAELIVEIIEASVD